MRAPCVCVRECAPERGGARRRCLPFLASFGLSKFGLLQHSNYGWTVPSAHAAIYARRGAALGPLHELQHARRVLFFLAVKPATRKKAERRCCGGRCRSFQASEQRLGPVADQAVSLGDCAEELAACRLARAYLDTFELEQASIDCY